MLNSDVTKYDETENVLSQSPTSDGEEGIGFEEIKGCLIRQRKRITSSWNNLNFDLMAKKWEI